MSLDSAKESVSGLVGGICLTYGGLPFENCKVRMQMQKYAFRDSFQDILGHSGLTGFWRGAIPGLASAISENTVLFTVNGIFRRMIQQNKEALSLQQEFLVGGMCGVVTSCVICPLEMLKVRQQSSGVLNVTGDNHWGLFKTGRHVWKTQGLSGFYSGLPALWARDIPFNILFFGSYETTSHFFSKYSQNPETNRSGRPKISKIETMMAGGLAGALAWSVVFPFDVVKTQIQSGREHGSIAQVFRKNLRQGSFKSLYRGCSMAIARAFIANGFLFLGVETTHELLSS